MQKLTLESQMIIFYVIYKIQLNKNKKKTYGKFAKKNKKIKFIF